MTADPNSGVASETFTDSRGTSWSLTATPDADGHNIDVSFTGSNGVSGTTQVDGNAVAPTVMPTATTLSVSRAAMSGTRHTMGRWAILGAAVTVAGAAVGVVGAAILLAAASPAILTVGAVVTLVGATVGLAGATITLVDTIQSNKKTGKK